MDSRRTKIIFSGIVGFASIAMVQLLSLRLDSLDIALTISLYSFAISLPFSTMILLLSFFKENYKKSIPESKIFITFVALVALIFLFGVAALFFHFDTQKGIIFAICAIIGIGIFNYRDEKIKVLNNKPKSRKTKSTQPAKEKNQSKKSK